MNTVNNAANHLWGHLLTNSTVWLMFKKKTWLRGNEKYLFHNLCYTYLWNVCLLLKTQESGKVVISDRIQIYTACLHQTLPVNSQVFPVLRHMWLYCCPWCWQLLSVSCCQVSLQHPRCKKAILHRLTLTSWHTVHWHTLRKHHLLNFQCGLCFKLRQLKLIEYKCLSMYCTGNFKRSHIFIYP